MAELIIRVGGADAALLTRLLDDSSTVQPHFAAPSRPARIVVDAPTAARSPGITRTAGRRRTPAHRPGDLLPAGPPAPG